MFEDIKDFVLDNLAGFGIMLGVALLGAFAAWVLILLAERLLHKYIANGKTDWRPIRTPWVLGVAAVVLHLWLTSSASGLTSGVVTVLGHAMAVVAIVALGWLTIRVTDVASHIVGERWDIEKQDNRKERAMVTKFRVMRRIWIAMVCVLTVGAVLFTFPSIRALGTGLLASAGVAGIVLGMALRPTVETFLASIQVAITEPISIDDVVIVEGEWGRIEEIRPTYVVVKIWDDRRLIVPLTYFISTPFQNWTRTKSEILGSVILKLDFQTPVDQVREKAGEFVKAAKDFDGRFWNVQISDADDKGMTLRVLCTAQDATKAWDLRCEVREKLITWLQQEHPGSLPRLRAQVDRLDGQEASS